MYMYNYVYIYIYSFGPSPYKLHKISQDVQPFLHNTELLMQVVPQPMTSSMASSMGVPSCTICGRAGQLNSCTNEIQLWLREKNRRTPGWWCNNHFDLTKGMGTHYKWRLEWLDLSILVGGAMCPSWKMMERKSMGRMTSLFYEMDNKSHVWNHQPVIWFPVDVPLNQCNWQW